jgi:uncharacterized protein YqgQ
VGDLTINTLDDKEGDYLKAKFVIKKEKRAEKFGNFSDWPGKGKRRGM